MGSEPDLDKSRPNAAPTITESQSPSNEDARGDTVSACVLANVNNFQCLRFLCRAVWLWRVILSP